MALPPGSKGPGLPVGPHRRQSLLWGAAPAPNANPTTTWNPSDKTASLTLSGGNLTAAASVNGQGVRGVDKQIAGKFYFEVTATTWAGLQPVVGIGTAAAPLATIGSTPTGCACIASNSNLIFINGSNTSISIGAQANGQVIGVAVDVTNALIWFCVARSGAWNGSSTANPATGVGGVSFAVLTGGGGGAIGVYPIFGAAFNPFSITANFGSYAFIGAVPSGFTAGWPASAATPTSALATQVAVEEWASPNPLAQVTQVALEVWGSVTTVGRGAGEADAAATVTGAGAAVTVPGVGAGEVDAIATVTGAGTTIQVAVGTGEADASADVEGAGFVGAIGAGEVDAFADVRGMGALVTPPGALPFLPGLGWSVHRRPTFDTIAATHPSGAEVRLALWRNCLWEFELSYDALASNAAYPGVWTNTLQTLMGFYLARGGQRGTFLFIDPDFNAMTGQGIGAGDGTTFAFPFYRAFGGQVEPVSWVTAVAAIYLDGVVQPSGWTVSGNVISFDAAPADGVVISADFSYGFICRFLEDSIDFEQFMDNLWQLKSLKFRQVRQ